MVIPNRSRCEMWHLTEENCDLMCKWMCVFFPRKAYSMDVLVELCQLLRSTAAKLSYLQQLNECLRGLIQRFQGVRTLLSSLTLPIFTLSHNFE